MLGARCVRPSGLTLRAPQVAPSPRCRRAGLNRRGLGRTGNHATASSSVRARKGTPSVRPRAAGGHFVAPPDWRARSPVWWLPGTCPRPRVTPGHRPRPSCLASGGDPGGQRARSPEPSALPRRPGRTARPEPSASSRREPGWDGRRATGRARAPFGTRKHPLLLFALVPARAVRQCVRWHRRRASGPGTSASGRLKAAPAADDDRDGRSPRYRRGERRNHGTHPGAEQ
jgi:hypothetical protein